MVDEYPRYYRLPKSELPWYHFGRWSAGSFLKKLLGGALAIAIVGLLLFLGLVLYNTYQAGGGKTFIAELGNIINPVRNFFYETFVQKPEMIGKAWTAKEEPVEEREGIFFEDFESVSRSKVKPGQTVKFRFDIDAKGESISDVPLKLSCEVEPRDIVKSLINYNHVNVYADQPLTYSGASCSFKVDSSVSSETTAKVKGSFSFPYKSLRVSLPVFFISQENFNALGKKDFFEENSIDLPLPIKASYKGEPVEVGIGVHDNYLQPVVIGPDFKPKVGISLINRWNGNVKEIKQILLYLPRGITINFEDDEKDILCPFYETPSSSTQYFHTYSADYSILREIDPFGEGKDDSFNTFECPLNIDKDLLVDMGRLPTKGAIQNEYMVSVEYIYEYSPKTQAFIIKPTGVA